MEPSVGSLIACWSSFGNVAGGSARGKQRTDSTHVLAAIRTLRRLECVGETMRHALNVPSRSCSHLAPGTHGPRVG